LSFGSHTWLVQTSVAAAVVHRPFSVGPVCVASVGIAVPFASVALHVCADSSHHSWAGQSLSTLQPVDAPQVPLEPQTPERQIVAPFALVHGPSPLA